ncbi:MAG TPA: hypothetical protein VGH54_09490 [Mycobacterium sp.]|jgi:hypothetical protein|uniref:hypothetical protein n=1 Tax=Mycobacterium sp. TaxID=1785 RepID=UPI002F416F03
MPFPDETELHLPNGITLNGDPDTDGVLMTCATLDGWGSPGSKTAGQSREGDHGESPAPNPKLNARTLQLTGRIQAPTRELRQHAEHRLTAALGLALFDLTVVDAIPLKVQAQRSGDMAVADDTDTQSTWQAELKCPDPRRYGTDRTITLGLPATTGGVQFPVRFPLRFTGTTLSGDVYAPNEGNMPAPITVTFTGPLQSPTIRNVDTGQWVTYNDALAAGEFVVLYLRYPLVALLQGTALRTGKVSTGGGGTLEIEPGGNNIAFRSAGGSGTADLAFSDTYQ